MNLERLLQVKVMIILVFQWSKLFPSCGPSNERGTADSKAAAATYEEGHTVDDDECDKTEEVGHRMATIFTAVLETTVVPKDPSTKAE